VHGFIDFDQPTLHSALIEAIIPLFELAMSEDVDPTERYIVLNVGAFGFIHEWGTNTQERSQV
jgi:hypothetical protein